MIPSYSPATTDNESLQADVMRFMAIIAFCLIAILALVKEAAPPPAAPAKPALKSPLSAETVVAPPAQSRPASPMVEASSVADSNSQPKPVQAPRETWQAPIDKPVADVGRTEATPRPAQASARLEVSALTTAAPSQVERSQSRPSAQAATVGSESEAEPAEPLAQAPAPEPQQEPEQDQGLSLRFASPGDFLRLIARAQISVYAFNSAGDVLGLNSAYDFMPARSPGQVYELLPQTIPALIVDALKQAPASATAGEFSWGITLPRHIEDKISNYLASAESGELVIDRYGDVHHVVAN